MLAKVRDKKTGLERTPSVKAYELLKHRYVLLGYLNDDGTPSDGPIQRNAVQDSVQKKRSVERVVAKSSVTREDLDRMNQEAMDRAMAKVAEKKAENIEPVKMETMEYIPPVVQTQFVEQIIKTPTPLKKVTPTKLTNKKK